MRLVAPIAVADCLDGVAFGTVAAGLGLGIAAPVALSATAFSGTAQFAALTVLGQRGGLASVLLAVVALNARYVVYGVSVAPGLSRGRLRRTIEAQLLTDVSWALSLRDGRPNRHVLVGAGLLELVAWTAGTAAGAAIGQAIGDYRVVGLDALLPAFFLCLLLGRVRMSPREIGMVGAAGGAAVLLTPLVPPGVPLVLVLLASLAWRPS